MLTLIIDMNDVADDLQNRVEETIDLIDLAVVDDIVGGLMLGALAAAETVYEHIDSGRQLNLLLPEDIDRSLETRDLHETYRGDFYCLLIELCNEDNPTIRKLADFGVDALGELMRRFIRAMFSHAGCRSMLDRLLTGSNLPVGVDYPILIPAFQKAPNGNDVIAKITLNTELTGAA